MTRNLVAAGHQVTVASRSRPPIDEAVAFGAIDGGTRGRGEAPRSSSSASPTPPRWSRCWTRWCPRSAPGTIVVDCSTIDPDVERAQHARVNATGARYLDAPVSGGTGARKKGPSR